MDMHPDNTTEDVVNEYLQADAQTRQSLFRSFMAQLRDVLANDVQAAVDWARRAVSIDLDYSSHLSLRKVLKQRLQTGPDPVRIAVLGGPTTTQLTWLIDNYLKSAQVEAVFYEGEYGLFCQSVLLPDAGLDAFKPEIVFFANNARDLAELDPGKTNSNDLDLLIEEQSAQWRHLWTLANQRWGALVIQNLFDSPIWSPFGHFGVRLDVSQKQYIDRVNMALIKEAPDYVVFHNQEDLIHEAGARQWFDPRFYHEAKMPCGPECLPLYAHSVAALILACKGKSKKVLVLDLDNTLWGGVIGDDGISGIRIGQGSGEGESFLAFQKYVKALSSRGILLAVCSKNDHANAIEPFEKHSEMVLKTSDISSFVANWQNKADNIRSIAEELNLGLDSFVFVDDNPAERAVVRRFLPQVAVPDMPADPACYIEALGRHRYFETIALTAEDLKRAEYYRQNRQRRELKEAHTDMESFLKSLEMKAVAEPVCKTNIERSTQLINKSNQFNLTTKRYSLAEVHEMAESEDWVAMTISLQDKMGDNGLISVVLAECSGKDLVIDTWVMSCRVLQRGVEFLTLALLIKRAKEHGCKRLLGCYIPTAKNKMVSEHYARLGFHLEHTDADGRSDWTLFLEQTAPVTSHHISVVEK